MFRSLWTFWQSAPQGRVLTPLLFTLLTHDCAKSHNLNHIMKYADDTTVQDMISSNDESAYIPPLLIINGSAVEMVWTTNFLAHNWRTPYQRYLSREWTLWYSWRKEASLLPTSPHPTQAPSRAFRPATSLSDTATATYLAASNCCG